MKKNKKTITFIHCVVEQLKRELKVMGDLA